MLHGGAIGTGIRSRLVVLLPAGAMLKSHGRGSAKAKPYPEPSQHYLTSTWERYQLYNPVSKPPVASHVPIIAVSITLLARLKFSSDCPAGGSTDSSLQKMQAMEFCGTATNDLKLIEIPLKMYIRGSMFVKAIQRWGKTSPDLHFSWVNNSGLHLNSGTGKVNPQRAFILESGSILHFYVWMWFWQIFHPLYELHDLRQIVLRWFRMTTAC